MDRKETVNPPMVKYMKKGFVPRDIRTLHDTFTHRCIEESSETIEGSDSRQFLLPSFLSSRFGKLRILDHRWEGRNERIFQGSVIGNGQMFYDAFFRMGSTIPRNRSDYRSFSLIRMTISSCSVFINH